MHVFRHLAKISAALFFTATSIFCLIASIPYTYNFLLKAPPFRFIPWFTVWNSWLALALGILLALVLWRGRLEGPDRGLFAVLIAACAYLAAFRPLLALRPSAYVFSLAVASLAPVALTGLCELHRRLRAQHNIGDGATFDYVSVVAVAGLLAVATEAAVLIRDYAENGRAHYGALDAERSLWVLISHLWIAIVTVTALNLLAGISAKFPRREALLRSVALTGVLASCLGFAVAMFLQNNLTYRGWQARLYAAAGAVSLTLFGVGYAQGIVVALRSMWRTRRALVLSSGAAILCTVVALAAVPTLVGDGDWNGAINHAAIWIFGALLATWIVAARTTPARLSGPAAAAVLLIGGCAYFAMVHGAILWATELGRTDDEIHRQLEQHAMRNASFDMVYGVLQREQSRDCGELCRTLEQYTDILDARTEREVRLVRDLKPATGERPNIIILVVDSLRPDYLGAYNPKVDFTPNLDGFARDSIVMRNAFTNYAGTTLAEPSIWSGALLLHSHYIQPFEKVNSLARLARTDGYEVAVSYDTVLEKLFPPEAEIVKLDLGRTWQEFEFSSTAKQFQQYLDDRRDRSRPFLFYAQPINLHQFSRANLPLPTANVWRQRPGFNNRIAFRLNELDTFFGQFLGDLKRRGLYDNSIIVVTSDHGEATGELGRLAHSGLLYPEIMRVPMIVHLPRSMRQKLNVDDNRLVSLIDIAPTLYYLLGHRPIEPNPLYGIPMFTESPEELEQYRRDDFLLASDSRAAYGLMSGDMRTFYATYDSPAKSYLYDLKLDPAGTRDVLSAELKSRYDTRIVQYLHEIAEFYGYRPDGSK